jgi:hypothetical protein
MGDDDGSCTVVLHYRDRHTEHFTLIGDFSPVQSSFEVVDKDGQVRHVEVDELKAVFFLKERRRREGEMQMGSSTGEAPLGAVARVEFFDGEVIKGLVQHYSIANRGFFLFPSAPESNNDRIFVVASALAMIDIEG